MQINVTQEDIDRGIPQCALSCPVARAVRAAFPTALYATATHMFISILNDTNTFQHWNTPESVSEFVKTFDNLQDVQPFSFELQEETVI